MWDGIINILFEIGIHGGIISFVMRDNLMTVLD